MRKIKIWTLQVGSWRLAKNKGIPYYDVTIKSGIRAFSPTWEMVSGYKTGILSEEEYTVKYLELMVVSQKERQSYWDDLANDDEFAIMCYCSAGAFCHRLILAGLVKEYLEANFDVEVIVMGELTKETA